MLSFGWNKAIKGINLGLLGEFIIAWVFHGIAMVMGASAMGGALVYVITLVVMMFVHCRIVGYWHISAVLFWPFFLSRISIFAAYYSGQEEPTYLKVVSGVVLALLVTEFIEKIVKFVRKNNACPHKGGQANNANAAAQQGTVAP